MKYAALGLALVFLAGCTVAMNRDAWDSWIGHNWREVASGCSPSGSTVSCPQALGTLYLQIDSQGTIQGWNYQHQD